MKARDRQLVLLALGAALLYYFSTRQAGASTTTDTTTVIRDSDPFTTHDPTVPVRDSLLAQLAPSAASEVPAPSGGGSSGATVKGALSLLTSAPKVLSAAKGLGGLLGTSSAAGAGTVAATTGPTLASTVIGSGSLSGPSALALTGSGTAATSSAGAGAAATGAGFSAAYAAGPIAAALIAVKAGLKVGSSSKNRTFGENVYQSSAGETFVAPNRVTHSTLGAGYRFSDSGRDYFVTDRDAAPVLAKLRQGDVAEARGFSQVLGYELAPGGEDVLREGRFAQGAKGAAFGFTAPGFFELKDTSIAALHERADEAARADAARRAGAASGELASLVSKSLTERGLTATQSARLAELSGPVAAPDTRGGGLGVAALPLAAARSAPIGN